MLDSAIITSIGIGSCYSVEHDHVIPMIGRIVTGSPDTIAGSFGTAHTTSIVLGNCGHTGIIVTGSQNIRMDSFRKARIGSIFVGDFIGIIVTGFSGVSVGG